MINLASLTCQNANGGYCRRYAIILNLKKL